MHSEKMLRALSVQYEMPFEDVLFIALNTNGINLGCGYDRMRGELHIDNTKLCSYATVRGQLEYYLALPVNSSSSFELRDDILYLNSERIGHMHDVTEDVCNSHYFRRQRTALNMNTNRRTSCHGCEFCYAIYQVPNDSKRLNTAEDLRGFFTAQLLHYEMEDLSQLVQISIVTGCYSDGEAVCNTIEAIRKVATEEFGFKGQIFYLGSQIDDKKYLRRLTAIKPVSLCFSIEAFERRDILKLNKEAMTIQKTIRLMELSREWGFETSFSYVLGLEPLNVVEKYFSIFSELVTQFPTVNLLQVHRKQPYTLYAKDADNLEFYLKARKIIENAFVNSTLRPITWANYRSPWILKFANEELHGIRTPGTSS